MRLEIPQHTLLESALRLEIDLKALEEERVRARQNPTSRTTSLPLVQDGMRKEIVRLVDFLRRYLEKVQQAVNINEGTAVLVDIGGALPTAAKEHVGKLVHLSKSGAVDELWWCRKTAVGGYEWKQVQVV